MPRAITHRDRRILGVSILIVAVSAYSPGLTNARQTPASPSQGGANSSRAQADAEVSKFTVRSNLVLLPTRVQTKAGETIYGLKAKQFMVDDNGVRQSVQVDDEPNASGLSLVVVVQYSRSAPFEFKKIKGLGPMIDAIAGAGPHEVAVLSYGEGPNLLGDFSGQPDAPRRALSRLRPCGEYHAATVDAVYYAIGMLRRRQTHYRRAILLIGETRDHGSRSKLDDVVTELGINDTVIYSVAFAPFRDEIFANPVERDGPPPNPQFTKPLPERSQPEASQSPPEDAPFFIDHPPRILWPPELLLAINALRRNTASELASLSGGEYFHFTNQKSFERDLEQISNQIHNYYLLRYKPPEGPIMVLHRLRVRVYGYPNAVIQTRKSYWSGIFESAPFR